MEQSKYPKGSEWRKWDLHVHTPMSIVQGFGGATKPVWDEYIAKLASLPPEVKVIGVTDYLFCDGYKYLLGRRAEFPNIELLVPNIEFRLDTFAGTANNSKRHNFHVIFDPSVSVDDVQEQFLNCLSNAYKIEDNLIWNQTPTVRSLEQLGRQIKAAAPSGNNVHNKGNLEVGFDNITYKIDDIFKLLEKDCFKGKFVTAVGYSEWDQGRWDQSAAEKRTLINSADFALTCSNDPAKIEEHSEGLAADKLHCLVLHSSDAHTLDRVGQTLLWVKADPTFAGLKQLLNEPMARKFIGDTPPSLKPVHKIINRLSIPKSNGWFPDDFNIKLNPDLVAIIGGRGSGKSAIAEAIAYGAGCKDERDEAFLQKATKHRQSVSGTKIILEWADGTSTEFIVGSLDTDAGLVQYLPQGAVEELCSPKNSDKLQEQIENVIFQALDDTDRLGASDFGELRKRILGDFRIEKDQVVRSIRSLNGKIAELDAILSRLPEKENTLAEKTAELKRLSDSLPKLPPADEKGQDELAALNDLKKTFDSKIIAFQELLVKVSEIEVKIKVFAGTVKDFMAELKTLLADAGIPHSSVFEVIVDEAGTKDILNSRKEAIGSDIKALREGSKDRVAILLAMDEAKLSYNNLQELNKAIEAKEKQTRAFETNKLKYQQQKKTMATVQTSIESLKAEIAKQKADGRPTKERLETERYAAYCAYFDILKREMDKMKELYKPLQESLSGGTATDSKLEFEARISYDLEVHCRNGLDIIDRTKKGNMRGEGKLLSCLTGFWEDLTNTNLGVTDIQSGIEGVIDKFAVFDESPIEIKEQLRANRTLEEFYNWLFDPSVFSIVSSLKFDGTDLYMLSPGQKGIILLMLYLEIDTADYRPMVIDQPEANLDNLSVYKDLIDYFRERKKYRQIIMVTHNPNLVVNTDSEQIIVADYNGNREPRLQYCSGSLEDRAKDIPETDVDDLKLGIIGQVCGILEGGRTAFRKRRQKYDFGETI